MPVVSPHRSSSSGLAGSYRSTYSSSLDKPYYGTSSYTPSRFSYSERYTTRSFTDTDGRRIFSRTGSITEDGVTTRFREESREGSVRRESYTSRDSSLREGSVLDGGGGGGSRRDGSLTRNESSRLSAINVAESVADIRNKYSPANYVPTVLRNRVAAATATSESNNISRSKTLNDIGLPPIETKGAAPKRKDIATSPNRLNRSSLAQNATTLSSSTGNSNNISAPTSQRNSVEKDYGNKTSFVEEDRRFDRASPTKQMGLNGLKNIGNTCFMNSVIQCLSNTKPLLEYVKKEGYTSDINTNVSSMKGALIKAFAQVIKELWSEDSLDRVVNTVSLKSQIQRFAPRFMGYSQQDAQEFLRYLLEGLHEDVNRVAEKPKPIHTEIEEKLSDGEKATESWHRYIRRENSKIVDLFVGQLKSTLRCTHCGHCSVTFDPFWDLSLPIPQKTGPVRLSQCLDSFTREETLDGDEKPTCSKCKERRKCTKSFTIHKFPKILVIHLKRFSPTERFRGKLSVTVEAPLEGLDMSNYSAEGHAPCRYNLYAISNHSGTTYSGHYTAYCRHPYSGAWHEYNDSRVSSISSRSVVSGEAYVLFYELDNKLSHL